MSKAYQAIILSILLLCITTAQVAAADCVAGATEIHVNFVNGNDYNSDGTENNGTNANAPVKTTDLLAKIHQGKDVCIISYDAANRELSREGIPYPPTGVPLPAPVIYALLVSLALLFVVAGQWLRRQSATQPVTVVSKSSP